MATTVTKQLVGANDSFIMLSNSDSSAPPESTVDRTADSCVVNNERSHRSRRKNDRSNKASRSEGPRRVDSGNSRRRTVSSLEIKNLELDHGDTLLKERVRIDKAGESPTEEIDQTISTARRKRRERHRHKVHLDNASSATVITSVIGDLVEEETRASNKNVGDEDVLVGDWKYPRTPPNTKNVSCKQYVEQKSNKKFFPRDLGDDEYDDVPRHTCSPVNIAVALQRCFRPLAGLCCGILGGISLWQCFTMIFWNSPLQESFMKYYSDCARAFQCLYYFLAIISLVSVLDSCDFSHVVKRNLWCSLPSRPAPVIISFILMSSLIVSLICAPLDDKLAMTLNDDWSFECNITSSAVDWDVEWWVTINYVRCVGAVLTWVLFSLCLGPDALWNQLIGLLNVSKNNGREIGENE